MEERGGEIEVRRQTVACWTDWGRKERGVWRRGVLSKRRRKSYGCQRESNSLVNGAIRLALKRD